MNMFSAVSSAQFTSARPAVVPLKDADKTNDGKYRLRRIVVEMRSIGTDSRLRKTVAPN